MKVIRKIVYLVLGASIMLGMAGCSANNKQEKKKVYSEEKTDDTLNEKAVSEKNSNVKSNVNNTQKENSDTKKQSDDIPERENVTDDTEKKKPEDVNKDAERNEEDFSDSSEKSEGIVIRGENEMEIIPDE